jgi:IMP dehydrogenase
MRNYRGKIEYYTGGEALAFSDVYLKPAYSDIKSRFGAQIDTSVSVSKNAPKLNIPFISAGMDSVTEDEMATEMALNGGLGEIHRNNSPEKQEELVRRVKEKMRKIAKDPPMLSQDSLVEDAMAILEKRNRGYVLVYEKKNFLGRISGIVTDKDFLAGDLKTPLRELMTPVKGKGKTLIVGNERTSLEKAVKIMKQERIEKLPVLDKRGNLIGVYTLKDYLQFSQYPNAALDKNGRLMVGAAVGVHDIDIERALKVVEAGADFLFLDIAHGHSVYTKTMMKRLKVREKIRTPIIVGNVATEEGVLFAYDVGADGIKVGIGPGYVCKTRNIAGTGIPQITAVLEAKDALANKKNPPPIISDGGVREPGDPAKAIACGADSVMIGSILAGTDRSPGDIVKINGGLQKRIRGMASLGVLEERKKLGDSTTNITVYAPEGREVFTPYQGSTQDLLLEYIGGLRSAMSYVGAHNIKEMQSARLVHISSNGSGEQSRSIVA